MSLKWLTHKDIGQKVRGWRTAAGLSQGELARRVGVPGSQSEISRIENAPAEYRGPGESPNINLLAAIAEYLGHSLEDLLDRDVGMDAEALHRRNSLIVASWLEEQLALVRKGAGITSLDAASIREEVEGVAPDKDAPRHDRDTA